VLDLMEADADLDTISATELGGPEGWALSEDPAWRSMADDLARTIPGHASQARGVELARALRVRLKLGSEPIPELAALLEERLSLEVAVLPLKPGLSAVAAFDDERRLAVVAVDVNEPYARQRFSQAHELGHVLAGDAHTESSATGQRTDAERQADRFAQEFLLPKQGIERWASQRGYAPGERLSFEAACVLAGAYGVSPQTTWIALEAVGLRPQEEPPTARDAAIAAGHWTRYRQEEVASRVPRIPSRIEGRVLAAFRSGRLTTGRAAAILSQDTRALSGETVSRHSSGSDAVASGL
jgi:Zn-dependent peptidase ImmA (M78 family)